MGVRFDRVLDALDGPFERVTSAITPGGQITGPSTTAGYLFSHHQNNAFIVLNRLLTANEDVMTVRLRTMPARLAIVHTRSFDVEFGQPRLARRHDHHWLPPMGMPILRMRTRFITLPS